VPAGELNPSPKLFGSPTGHPQVDERPVRLALEHLAQPRGGTVTDTVALASEPPDNARAGAEYVDADTPTTDTGSPETAQNEAA